MLSDRLVDIRPVTMRDADDVRRRGPQRGRRARRFGRLPERLGPAAAGRPARADAGWLDGLAPDTPLVIIHNSGHKAYFNSAAARQTGLTRDTPDPKGAKYGRDADGELDGTAEETGAVFPLLGGAIDPSDYPAMLLAECARLNRAGLTTCSEMAFDPMFRPVLDDVCAATLTVRLRTYEISTAQMTTDANAGQRRRHGAAGRHQDLGGRVAVDRQHRPVVPLPGHRRHPHHRRHAGIVWARQLHPRAAHRDRRRVLPAGLADGLPRAGRRRRRHDPRRLRRGAATHPRDDHRLRLEHVGAIPNEQLQRAHDLGVTCSIFVDQIHYWGDVIVDGLFGAEHGSRWMPAGSAVATGMRISLHNDPPVTPEEPLRNISVAVTRIAPSGRVLGPEERLTVEQAIRAQTIDAAWQLFVRRRRRLAGGRQVRRPGGAVGRSARGAAGDDRRPRGARDVPGGPPCLRQFRLTVAVDVARSIHV